MGYILDVGQKSLRLEALAVNAPNTRLAFLSLQALLTPCPGKNLPVCKINHVSVLATLSTTVAVSIPWLLRPRRLWQLGLLGRLRRRAHVRLVASVFWFLRLGRPGLHRACSAGRRVAAVAMNRHCLRDGFCRRAAAFSMAINVRGRFDAPCGSLNAVLPRREARKREGTRAHNKG